ncbi:glycine--tRNA ligase subunit beta [Geobacter sp. DSM 9736]|uniref:glycine--tRNA ligase subunit beta n=1 Tax=Geobacter sp. DSM 9736 TaxID=1277350 RepID=UPI000B506FE5|nr:glycine--tRNA ligase subunit beta [Geobacter sp. DSM 9736]SNB48061.1 glycyl-tRNA synthetase beta chain [Geobacter sp. DSM 9736]
MTKELFLEVGTEEIPAGFLPKAMADMESLVRRELENAHISFTGINNLATPRRLAMCVTGLPAVQPDTETTAMGPAKNIAFDSSGTPTKAAEGFARGQGVAVADLQVVSTDKGEYIAAVRKESGRPVAELLGDILPRLVSSIPFKKSMRWGDQEVRFARPIHWIVALFDGIVVPFSFGSVQSGNVSRGHRFMANQPFPVRDFAHYLEECERHFVIPEPERRKEIIRREIHRLAKSAGGHLLPDEGLLEEVSYLCEYPSAVHGTFSAEFLKVPKEVLITSMRSHQRYFSLVDDSGKLLPGFITINNTLTEDPSVVVRGNERVLRARLSDARFFFEEDQKVRLEDRVESLKNVVYQAKLGTSFEKMERFRALAEGLAGQLRPELKDKVSRAAFLCKADLVSGMVGEFPEVQGIMGREYALLQGEDRQVAAAIAEHYLPTQAGGELPASDLGALVSIADKLDTICGCFGVGLIPTGSADPYALRRSALGIINIILDRKYPLSLAGLINSALEKLEKKLTRGREDVFRDVRQFFEDRFVNLLSGQNSADAVDAAVAAGCDDLVDCAARIEALSGFRSREDFEPLAVAFKRVCNIVKEPVSVPVNEDLFQDEAERNLLASFKAAEAAVAQAVGQRDYLAALTEIATLKGAVDQFFEQVMVMAEDEQVRTNRLALLQEIKGLFRDIADFAKLAA